MLRQSLTRRVRCHAEGSNRAPAARPTPGSDPRMRPTEDASSSSRPTPGNDPRMQAQQPDSVPELTVRNLMDADVEGVARVDRGEDDDRDPGRVQLLVLGDAAALLAFAMVGRINHGELLDAETFATVLPFWLGWFAVGSVMGAYGKEARGGYPAPAAAAAAKTWALATPLALVLRGISRGYSPPTPFIAVAFVATGVLMIGWRTALAAATKPEEELTPMEKFKRRKNKNGNPLEFMQLLTSLTKRW